ncbi:MAG TPA: hypothetical protein VKU19_02540 [Bryobacteraceae bacterium]|nr:hypothetical protein [Bryobacteraceae bacterium]
MKKTVWIAIAFCVLVVGFVIYSSMGGERVSCEVCMVFKGQRDCRRASARTRENALRTAVSQACAQLSGGVTETNQCENTAPESVNWQP